jgi:hypothetical protein
MSGAARETEINLATGQSNYSKEAIFIAEDLLRLEDIEEDQSTWLDKNRRLVELITDSHIRIGLATFTDAIDQLTADRNIAPEWVKWRTTVLECILNPTQVQPPKCPLHTDILVSVKPADDSRNVRALRRAYSDKQWLNEHGAHWVIVHHGTIHGKFSEHEAAMKEAIDTYGMLGNFICPYIYEYYCHYKAQIYDQQQEFADEVRDL